VLRYFLAGAFLAGAFLAGAFFAGAFFAAAGLAAAFLAGAFLAAGFAAAGFLITVFVAMRNTPFVFVNVIHKYRFFFSSWQQKNYIFKFFFKK